jgi:hypothetical protein
VSRRWLRIALAAVDGGAVYLAVGLAMVALGFAVGQTGTADRAGREGGRPAPKAANR